MTPPLADRLAAAFWDAAGGRPPPPRDVEPALPRAAPEVFVRAAVPVTPTAVRAWFRRASGVSPPGADDPRSLHGAVLAYRGRAVLFVAADLSPPDRRMILAHEFGHYLAEYAWPRRRVLRRLGPAVRPVLDGDRQPSEAEGWAAALAGVRLGVHAHYLDRGTAADPDRLGRAEELASAVAFELLAPAAEVLAEWPADYGSVLVSKYGLSDRWATGYARRLTQRADRELTPSRRWGL